MSRSREAWRHRGRGLERHGYTKEEGSRLFNFLVLICPEQHHLAVLKNSAEEFQSGRLTSGHIQ